MRVVGMTGKSGEFRKFLPRKCWKLEIVPFFFLNKKTLKTSGAPPDRRGSPDRTVQPRPDSQGRILLNSGKAVRSGGLGNGSGRERGSFLSVRVFSYGPGLNFYSSEIIYTNE